MIATYDRLQPWRPAVDALSAFPDQTRVCVGVGTCLERGAGFSRSRRQRIFLLFPSVFTSPHLLVVTVADDQPPVVEMDQVGFWMLLILYAAGLVYCVRLLRRLRRHRDTL